MTRAEVAELADARGSGPRTRKGVGVRVPSSAPKNPSSATFLGSGHGNAVHRAMTIPSGLACPETKVPA